MKILVLSSGGDAPGMNRFIYELYKKFRDKLYFAYAGFTGLVDGQIFPVKSVIDPRLKNEAGTVIKSSRLPEFKEKKVFKMGLKNAQDFDVVVILGGNGSEKGAKELFENKVNTIFVPGTIDNDVENSFYSIGFSTAVKEGVYAVENSMKSIDAFESCCIFEVMGKEHEAIAESVAKIVSADGCISKESDLDIENLKNVILKNKVLGKSTCIILRENIIPAPKLAQKLNEMLGFNCVKFHIVGRTQRGGKPTQEEILMAKKFAKKTIDCIKKQVYGVRILADEKMNIIIKQFI